MIYQVTITLKSGRSITQKVEARSAERAITAALAIQEVKEFINGESPIAIKADRL
jgi:hypothetical protein